MQPFCVFGGILLAAAAALVLQGCRHKPTPAERLAEFVKEAQAGGKTVFQDTTEGRPLTLLLESCKVYRLEATGEKVTKHEVLRTGFLLWFSGCMEQRAWREGQYIFVFLRNMEVGAGGGNASGGTYRSKNGIDWEKEMRKGWLPVAEAQN